MGDGIEGGREYGREYGREHRRKALICLCAISTALAGVTRGAAADGPNAEAASSGPSAAATPPVPAEPHPRLFMSPANLARFAAQARTAGSAAAEQVRQCQATLDEPGAYVERGGVDGRNWPNAALACAFAYLTTRESHYLGQAIRYWRASLEDDDKLGDRQGCTAAHANDDWRRWNDQPPAPPVLLTITHDTGYPIRWYGPYLALTYDWLYGAPGVDEALRHQTRACLTRWLDYYGERGYLHDEAGFNYNAGFVVAKTLGAIAIGNDGGADGHLWGETVRDLFAKVLIEGGLAGAEAASDASAVAPSRSASAPRPAAAAGVMVGGDWGSWQYGPLSVAEYAAATRALEDHGVAQPAMDAWLDSLIVRHVHGTTPNVNEQFAGNGDYESETIYAEQDALQTSAVLLGHSTERAAAWAAFERRQQKITRAAYFWDALAEIREVTPRDYRAEMPQPPLGYLARGTGTLYARTDWDAGSNGFWAVFMSSRDNADHQHLAASNFVFNRGPDPLIVDSSNYGEPSTLETNAVSADSPTSVGDYAFTQGPWSEASLPWARITPAGVFAARADFARAFIFNERPSPIRYARRDWVMLPEGEIVTIDRVRTGSAARHMYVNFHVNTKETLRMAPGAHAATGKVGASSSVAIHAVMLSGGAGPRLAQPPVGSCKLECSSPCGACAAARFPVDLYSVRVPGPLAVAVHVIDGLGARETPAEAVSVNDDLRDPPPKQNAAVIGASVLRAGVRSYVIASSLPAEAAEPRRAAAAADGAEAEALADATTATAMDYVTSGEAPARHVVYDAPEARDGTSRVSASAEAGRCRIHIVAGDGGPSGVAGRPLLFRVAKASESCAIGGDIGMRPAGEAMRAARRTAVGDGSGAADAARPGCACASGGSRGVAVSFAVAIGLAITPTRRRRGARRRARPT